MGVFSDFIASRPSLSTPQERVAKRELEGLQDADVPSGFENRLGWAVLKVLGLTDIAAPPFQGDLLGYDPQTIDYQQYPISPDTARIIVNQIMIDDGNADLMDDLLIHLDLCHSDPGELCQSAPPQAANQAPVITYTGGNFVFLGNGTQNFTGGKALTIADPDIPGNDEVVNLEITVNQPAGGGYTVDFSLSGTAGITVIQGSASDEESLLEIEGTVAAINTAMANAVVEVKDSSAGGTASLDIVVNDKGISGSGGPQEDSVNIGVNLLL